MVLVVAALALSGCIQDMGPVSDGGTDGMGEDGTDGMGEDGTDGMGEDGTDGMNGNSDGMHSGGISIEEVAMHDSGDDCWLVISGRVYDVTSFIPFHPGGNAILEGCGKDATQLFETRPMGSGTPHSEAARNRRGTLEIGALE